MSIRLALALFIGSLPQNDLVRSYKKPRGSADDFGLQGCGAGVLEAQGLLERYDATARNRYAFVDARNAQLDSARGNRLDVGNTRQVNDIAAVNAEEAKITELGLELCQRRRYRYRSNRPWP